MRQQMLLFRPVIKGEAGDAGKQSMTRRPEDFFTVNQVNINGVQLTSSNR